MRALSPRSVHDSTPVAPYWAAVPWANVQQQDQPEKWDRQVLLVLPQAPKKVEETLGQWLAQSVSKNRNMARFLLPKARASGFSRKRKPVSRSPTCGVGARIQRGGRAVAGMLTIATAGGS